MTEGRKAAFKAVLGASAGDMVQVLAASLGLAVLLQVSSLAFFIIKIPGAMFVIMGFFVMIAYAVVPRNYVAGSQKMKEYRPI
nr:LysE family transporter [Pelosinus baikalensis]